jgi:hypothetical protein
MEPYMKIHQHPLKAEPNLTGIMPSGYREYVSPSRISGTAKNQLEAYT